LRDRLAVVSQAPTLFDTSVGENIPLLWVFPDGGSRDGGPLLLNVLSTKI